MMYAHHINSAITINRECYFIYTHTHTTSSPLYTHTLNYTEACGKTFKFPFKNSKLQVINGKILCSANNSVKTTIIT